MQDFSSSEPAIVAPGEIAFCAATKAHFALYRDWAQRSNLHFKWGGSAENWYELQRQPQSLPALVSLRRREWIDFTQRGLNHQGARRTLIIATDWRTAEILDALKNGWVHVVTQPFTPSTFISNVKWLLEPHGEPALNPGHIQPTYVSEAHLELDLTIGGSNRGMEFLVGQWVEQFLRGRVKSIHVRHTRLAAGELLSNAIEWGNQLKAGSVVHVVVAFDGHRVMLKMIDQGHGFNVAATLNDHRDPTSRMRDRIASGKRPGGFGIVLVKRLMDSLSLQEGGRIAIATLNV